MWGRAERYLTMSIQKISLSTLELLMKLWKSEQPLVIGHTANFWCPQILPGALGWKTGQWVLWLALALILVNSPHLEIAIPEFWAHCHKAGVAAGEMTAYTYGNLLVFHHSFLKWWHSSRLQSPNFFRVWLAGQSIKSSPSPLSMIVPVA